MAYGARKTKTLSAAGAIASGVSELLFLVFTGATAGDSIDLKNGGSGGTSVTGALLVPANGKVVIGPFDEGKGIVFSTDMYAAISKTGAAAMFAVYRELA